MQGRFKRIFLVFACLFYFNNTLALVDRIPVSAFASLPGVE